MSIRKALSILGLLAPALVAGSAYAVEPGFFVGASGGQTFVDTDADDFGFKGNRDFNIDDDDTGWKAYLGYNFTTWLGVEAGYKDFGGVSDSLRGNNIDVDLTGWDGFLVGTLPIGPVDLFAKVGAISLETEVDTNNFSAHDDDTQFAYGVGMAYNIGHWGLRVEAEGFDDNEVDDFYFVSAGVTYHFFRDTAEPVVAAAAPEPVPEQCPDTDRDGVCDGDDQCPNTPAGVRVDPIGCDCDYTLNLEFAFDSDKLSPNDTARLDELASVLKNPKLGTVRGTIEGHTDSKGSESYNLGLSKRRAQAVANYLQASGVAISDRFTVNGFGESRPVASNDTEEGRAQNRRVVVSRTDCAAR
jgi:OOP family OmpA-OmpF porin